MQFHFAIIIIFFARNTPSAYARRGHQYGYVWVARMHFFGISPKPFRSAFLEPWRGPLAPGNRLEPALSPRNGLVSGGWLQ